MGVEFLCCCTGVKRTDQIAANIQPRDYPTLGLPNSDSTYRAKSQKQKLDA